MNSNIGPDLLSQKETLASSPLVSAHQLIHKAGLKERKGSFDSATVLHELAIEDLKKSLKFVTCATTIKSLKLQVDYQERQLELLRNKARNISNLREAIKNHIVQMDENKSSEGHKDISDNCQEITNLIVSLEKLLNKPDTKQDDLAKAVERIKLCNAKIIENSKIILRELKTALSENEELKLKVKELEDKSNESPLALLREATAQLDISSENDMHDGSLAYELPPIGTPKLDFLDDMPRKRKMQL